MPLDAAMRSTFSTDAHFAAYHAPELPHRLCVDLVRNPENAGRIPNGVNMTLAVFDVDYGNAHKSGAPTSVQADDWWVAEKAKIAKLRKQHPAGYAYRTRGGYRVLYVLDEIVTLRDERDDARWTLTYLSWVAYLCRRFDILADRACAEWVRLFRLPRATRDSKPENLETIGDPSRIGPWGCDPSRDDVAAATALSRRKTAKPRIVTSAYAGDGILFYAFQNRGWMGQKIEAGKWSVRCPWAKSHTCGTDFNTSTILYAPGPGRQLGWFYCSHSHCQSTTVSQVLKVFSDYELDAAKRAAGLSPAA